MNRCLTHFAAVITIKHVSTFVNKVEIPCNFKEIFDLIDKCRYVFYGYDGSLSNLCLLSDSVTLAVLFVNFSFCEFFGNVDFLKNLFECFYNCGNLKL